MNSDWLDLVMLFCTQKFTWIPLYILLFYWLCRLLKFNWKYIAIVAVFVALAITLSDQLSVHLFKNVFLRFRPCHNADIAHLVHVVGKCGGAYGFVSSHAANTFAIATFLSLIALEFSYKKKKLFVVGIFSWALLVSYSRIYCGVHYPLDIVGGAILGSGIAIVVVSLLKRATQNNTSLFNKNF
ncbi:MAG: phosphatase PAP2 family protein [Bacteroidetes bacterium]|nr:phosphatase PAP2 family protein [Bacteroidota bacterium]